MKDNANSFKNMYAIIIITFIVAIFITIYLYANTGLIILRNKIIGSTNITAFTLIDDLTINEFKAKAYYEDKRFIIIGKLIVIHPDGNSITINSNKHNNSSNRIKASIIYPNTLKDKIMELKIDQIITIDVYIVNVDKLEGYSGELIDIK